MLGGFVVANLIGTWLWHRRDTVAPHRAIQVLLAVIGVSAFGGILAFDLLGHIAAKDRLLVYWWLIFVPGLMLMFYLREREAAAKR